MMETSFTPAAALIGGALIGAASVLLMALHGRILGATGILGGLMRFNSRNDWLFRAALVAGMVLAPVTILFATGTAPELQVPVSRAEVILGGLVVGLGVAWGGGCTSGHGVCGVARFSPRSIVATIAFMAAGFATVYVSRHLIGA